jgi:hypothetical protein
VDRLSPVERALGSRSVSRLFARATRTDDASSLRALVQKTSAAMSSPGSWSAVAVPDADPASPRSIYHVAGDDSERQDFLKDVRRQK